MRSEMLTVADQRLGDTVLLQDEGRLAGLAVCHYGPGSEGGSRVCYVKFGAVHPNRAASNFERLLRSCESIAAEERRSRVVAGVHTARREGYRDMLGSGFHTGVQGVAMHRRDEPGYNRPGVYLLG